MAANPSKSLVTREFFSDLHGRLGHLVREEVHSHAQFWLARELAAALGYSRWPAFVKLIDEAMAACSAAGQNVDQHFVAILELVPGGDDAADHIEDYALSRYACQLVAQQADAKRPAVAYAKLYFAVDPSQSQSLDEHLADAERVLARKKLTQSEKTLSGLIYERVESELGFSRIRRKGDQALFGGATTRQMK